MKIIVDEIPSDPSKCLFYINDHKGICGLRGAEFPCYIPYEECPYLLERGNTE